MKIYLVRHGEVLHNALKQYNTIDEDLNEKGIKQAEELRDKIKNMEFDVIISSPLVRARHTVDIININNTKVIFDDRISERSCGDLSGKPFGAINREEYWNYNTIIQYGTSENILSFFKRVHSFLDELKEKNYNNVLIVAHSGVSKAFSAYFEGVNDGLFLDKGLKNCEIKGYEL